MFSGVPRRSKGLVLALARVEDGLAAPGAQEALGVAHGGGWVGGDLGGFRHGDGEELVARDDGVGEASARVRPTGPAPTMRMG
jgi:hypothetical protein